MGWEMRRWNRQDGKCFHCGEPMLLTPARKKKSGQYDLGWTREHVVPLALGGNKGNANVVLAHLKCNSSRGCKPPTPRMIQQLKQLLRPM